MWKKVVEGQPLISKELVEKGREKRDFGGRIP